MEVDVLNALRSQTAYLSGNRNSPLLVVNVIGVDQQATNKSPLELCLEYLVSILSDDTLKNGMNVIINGQKCGWRIAKATADLVSDFLGEKLRKLFIVRPDAFWDKQRLENCAKSQRSKDTLIVTKSRLLKYFEMNDLPDELGGSLAYNHEQWLRNRMRIEEFKKSTNHLMNVQLQTIQEKLLDRKMFRLGDIEQLVQSHTAMNDDIQKKIRNAVANGNILLIELNDSLSKNYCISRDIVDAKETIKSILNALERKQTDFGVVWQCFERNIIDLQRLKTLERSVEYVTNWILSNGQVVLNTQKTIGIDLKSSEELRNDHDRLEMQCWNTFGVYAEVIYKIDSFKNLRDTQAYSDLKSQKDLMDFICGCFAARLERRRHVLVACIRFHRFIETYYEKTRRTIDSFLNGDHINEFGDYKSDLIKLNDCNKNLEKIANLFNNEGEKLSDLLSMPIKDSLGHNIEIDYSEDIANVRKLLQTALAHRKTFMKSIDLQTMTLERVNFISTYERDASVSLKWLDDLHTVITDTYSFVGCSIYEIQKQKEELQSIQDTAKAVYHYGHQLLNAALAMRVTCKLQDEGNRELMQQLEDRWQHLDTLSQEQMTRLRVSAVFHRTMEEQCQKLKDLKAMVSTVSEVNDKEQQMYDLRMHLLSRENLIMEVGRMVRLGRLLKSRLKEPFKTDRIPLPKKDLEAIAEATPNVMATNAIVGKLNEVSKEAEALDIALRDTQNCLEMGGNCSSNSNSLDRKTDGNVSIDSRDTIEELNSITKSSTEDESFVTASECTFTPQSHSSAYETASEGGLMSPWWANSSVDKSSFETCSSSDMDSEVPTMQLLTGVISSASVSFDESELSFLSTLQEPFNDNNDECGEFDDDLERAAIACESYDFSDSTAEIQTHETDTDTDDKDDAKDPFSSEPSCSSWSLVTKHTVKGCL